MITDGKKWHYLAVKKSSALLRGVTSNHVRDFHLGQKINSKNRKMHAKIMIIAVQKCQKREYNKI